MIRGCSPLLGEHLQDHRGAGGGHAEESGVDHAPCSAAAHGVRVGLPRQHRQGGDAVEREPTCPGAIQRHGNSITGRQPRYAQPGPAAALALQTPSPTPFGEQTVMPRPARSIVPTSELVPSLAVGTCALGCRDGPPARAQCGWTAPSIGSSYRPSPRMRVIAPAARARAVRSSLLRAANTCVCRCCRSTAARCEALRPSVDKVTWENRRLCR